MQKVFSKEFFTELARECSFNADELRLLGEFRNHEILVDGDTYDMLVRVQDQFERLEAMGDDEYRGFYIEVPRPTLDEWGDCDELIEAGECDSREDYIREWEFWNPMETRWFYVGSSRYKDCRVLHFTDRRRTYFVITNRSSYMNRECGGFIDKWYAEAVERICSYLSKLLEVIVSYPDDFNQYVAENLPYQQRDGRIARKELNRVVPEMKIKVEDEATAVMALEDSAQKRFRPPFETMSIRLYCKYFRIAHKAYEHYFEKWGRISRPRSAASDTAYYTNVKFTDVESLYDIDSQDDFKKFARDHYGELGLSRLNIVASDYERPGWRILVSNSYSAYVDLAIEVATALYKSGAPLEILDAEKLLKILREEDNVRLTPYVFHDYMNHHEEGTVYCLPWEYECGNDKDATLTLAQYHDIVSLAEWQEIGKVKVIS